MGDRIFAAATAALLGAGAAALILAALFDSSVLAVVGAACIVGAAVSRQVWTWRGTGRLGILVLGVLASVVLAGFVAQKVFG